VEWVFRRLTGQLLARSALDRSGTGLAVVESYLRAQFGASIGRTRFDERPNTDQSDI
jgi:hypothetical protein